VPANLPSAPADNLGTQSPIDDRRAARAKTPCDAATSSKRNSAGSYGRSDTHRSLPGTPYTAPRRRDSARRWHGKSAGRLGSRPNRYVPMFHSIVSRQSRLYLPRKAFGCRPGCVWFSGLRRRAARGRASRPDNPHWPASPSRAPMPARPPARGDSQGWTAYRAASTDGQCAFLCNRPASRPRACPSRSAPIQLCERAAAESGVVVARIGKDFLPAEAALPKQAEPAFRFGQFAPYVTARQVILAALSERNGFGRKSKMRSLELHEPAMMVEADFGHAALQGAQPGPSFLCKDLAASRWCLDIPCAADP